MGIAQVGFIANAVGAFHFSLSGGSGIPADLAAATTTITVPRTASLFLVGTGAEAIAASFIVQGSLSLMMLSVTGGSTTAISVAAGGSLTVTQTNFTDTGSSTAISVAAGGSVTVSASQLVDNEEGRAQPFPCDGTLTQIITLAHACAGAHAGAVTMRGTMVFTMAAPLVCDAASGRCNTLVCEAASGRCNTAHCPAHATLALGGRYCSDLVGECVGPSGSSDYVNAKYKTGVTRPACQAECDANVACTGYSYHASNLFLACQVHGPGLDTDLGGGWTAYTHPVTLIAGADGHSTWVCAAVAGRN
jgi:hypothetical protein